MLFLHHSYTIESFSASDYAALFDNEVTRILDLCALTRSTTRPEPMMPTICRKMPGQLNETFVVLNVVVIKRKLSTTRRSLHVPEIWRDQRSKIVESRTNFIQDKVSASVWLQGSQEAWPKYGSPKRLVSPQRSDSTIHLCCRSCCTTQRHGR